MCLEVQALYVGSREGSLVRGRDATKDLLDVDLEAGGKREGRGGRERGRQNGLVRGVEGERKGMG